MKKRILILVVTILCLCFTAGCFRTEEEKTFEKEGMRITLTTGFSEKELENCTVCYQNLLIAVVATKEEFSLVDGASEWTLGQYTSITISGNRLNCEAQDREGKDYKYFTYERSVDGVDFFYLATTHKADDAFWLIQFGCKKSNKDQNYDKFLSWADTITFGVDAPDEAE